jgi:hypothetical protein
MVNCPILGRYGLSILHLVRHARFYTVDFVIALLGYITVSVLNCFKHVRVLWNYMKFAQMSTICLMRHVAYYCFIILSITGSVYVYYTSKQHKYIHMFSSTILLMFVSLALEVLHTCNCTTFININ